MEHLHGVLPGDAPGRLCLRPHHHTLARRSQSGQGPSRGPLPPGGAVRRRRADRRQQKSHRRRRQSHRRRPSPAAPGRRPAVLRRQYHLASPATVVLQHGPSVGPRSVLPVHGQQHGQHVGPDRLPGPRRAFLAAPGPALRLVDRLRAVHPVDRNLRRAALEVGGGRGGGGRADARQHSRRRRRTKYRRENRRARDAIARPKSQSASSNNRHRHQRKRRRPTRR